MSLAALLQRENAFDEPLQEMFYAALYTAGQFEIRFADFLKPFDLTPWQYDILAVLHDAGGQLATKVVGERLVKKAGALSAYVDRLERVGLVARSRSDVDRRVVLVEITQRGRNVLEAIQKLSMDWEEKLIGHLTYKEAFEVSRILKKAAKPIP